MNKLPELSIFFPFWNEEDNVERVVRGAIPIAKKLQKNGKLLWLMMDHRIILLQFLKN